eukprot:m.118614 g.118614  ORF g.118614 m.118614 type:complete len:144 (-) comp15569_c0_seq9:77-508(-)
MGAIPVIVDWQADGLASMFNGVLFETQDRFEDIFVVLDWRSAHEHPEYILERLTSIVVSGEYLKRQRRIRRMVDYLAYRLDSKHEDAISLFVQLLQENNEQMHNKVKEWPHDAKLSSDITENAKWTVTKPYPRLRQEYSTWNI